MLSHSVVSNSLQHHRQTLQKAKVYLISDLEEDFVRSIFLSPMPSAQAALDAAFAELGEDASVLAMPFGGSTLPRIIVS